MAELAQARERVAHYRKTAATLRQRAAETAVSDHARTSYVNLAAAYEHLAETVEHLRVIGVAERDAIEH